MVATGWMAVKLGLLPEPDFQRIEGALQRLHLPVRLSDVDARAVLLALQRDKKVRQGRNIWVLPRRIGEAVRTADVAPELAAQALDYLSQAGEAMDPPR